MTLQDQPRGVVLARSKEGNDELRSMLGAMGIPTSAVETIRFEDPSDSSLVEEAVAGVSGYDWAVFTSPRAAALFVKRAGGRAGEREGWPKVAAVGPKTRAVLESAGIRVDFVPGRYLTSALGEGLPKGAGRKVLLFRSDIGQKSLVRLLEKRGFEVVDIAAYRTRPIEGEVAQEETAGARLVVFASPSEVNGLQTRLGPVRFGGVASRATAVCIGPVTAEAAITAGFKSVAFPAEHTVEALATKVKELAAHG